MTRRVAWSNYALADLLDQIEHIALHDLAAAERVAARIDESAAGLGTFATGHAGRVHGTFEKAVARLPYIIAYQLSDDMVVILRVIHAARDRRDGDWPR